jgi:hypothetical protein
VTPAARFWHVKRRRLIVGVEKLALQGIFVSRSATFEDSFYAEFAGNAFCVPVVLSIVACIFVIIGRRQPQMRSGDGASDALALLDALLTDGLAE